MPFTTNPFIAEVKERIELFLYPSFGPSWHGEL
jgi:hypothetical protein